MTPVPPSLGFVEGVAQPLEKRFEVLKDVGDGSFGSVVLARVRGTRNKVAIKSMKKSFDSFSECLRLREVQSLRSIPRHPHIVPVLDAFLDPITHKLHLVMELMDINLYQFLKSLDNRPLEPRTVQVILWQVCSALQHIHAHGFFHRDIKPENVLISIMHPHHKSTPSNSSRQVFTPPQTPPAKHNPSQYLVKLADFGLAREIRSRPPYTSYVSTRWYRAPEVLLRAEEYSAPVDIWAVGAMAIEVATLRPIFPGNNEIDQLWRVCEVMGTPSDWYTTDERTGRKVRIGGGPWGHGLKLAGALQFKFPNVPPMDMTTILTSPWPKSLSDFVVSCLSWDPKRRPTSQQCLFHEYFKDVERYLPVREALPTPPATMHTTTAAAVQATKPVDAPRGVRHQPSYVPMTTHVPQQELTHHQSQPQLQQSSKGGWFTRGRDKKRDSSFSQLSSQAPQLPALNIQPAVAPKITVPGTNGGMAFSPGKSGRPQYEQKASYDHVEGPPPNHAKVSDQVSNRISWTHQVQVPGQQSKQLSLGTLPDPPVLPDLSLPSIRPLSPLHNGVFGESSSPRKVLKSEVAPAPEKSPIRVPVVNTFIQQAQSLELEEKSIAIQPPKIGRQLSNASRDVPKTSSPDESPTDDLNAPGKAGFLAHFRKKARKRMSGSGDDFENSMPITPIAPQLGPLQVGGDKSLRNSVVMEDFFEDAQETFEGDSLLKQVDEALSAAGGFKTLQHITIAPSPMKGLSSHPPSSHKNGIGPPPSILPVKFTRPLPSPYPTNISESPPKLSPLPQLAIPKRGSSRKTADTPDSSRARRPNAASSPLARMPEELSMTTVTIPGAYPVCSSPDQLSPYESLSVSMSRSTTNLSVTLPGAYPKEQRGRYNSSSSGLSSAASYRTAFDPDTWDSEEQKHKEEQAALQQSLMDATRAMRVLEKYSFTDWTEKVTERKASPVSTWPTPPYVDDNNDSRRAVPPPRGDIDYFRIGIPSPR